MKRGRLRSAITGRFVRRAGADPTTTVEDRSSERVRELERRVWALEQGLLTAATILETVPVAAGFDEERNRAVAAARSLANTTERTP